MSSAMKFHSAQRGGGGGEGRHTRGGGRRQPPDLATTAPSLAPSTTAARSDLFMCSSFLGFWDIDLGIWAR